MYPSYVSEGVTSSQQFLFGIQNVIHQSLRIVSKRVADYLLYSVSRILQIIDQILMDSQFNNW